MMRRTSALLLCLTWSAFALEVQGEVPPQPYPVIENLLPTDPVFRQWQNRLRQGFKKGQDSPLVFFAYQIKKGDTLASLAGKINGWQAGLATLNGLSSIADLREGQWILLPTHKGVFVYDPPIGSLQELMIASREREQAQELTLWREGHPHKVYFFAFDRDKRSGDFQSSERYFFLDSSFSFPLRQFVISSGFGWRQAPISGRRLYHTGIDLAVPAGTLAYPAKAGTVIKVSYNKVYGHYVVVRHTNGYQSLYGHFRKVLVKQGQIVDKNTSVGEVGSTGMSTGPHLHFEIHKRGEIQNPSKILGGN